MKEPGWAALEEFSTRKHGCIVPKDHTKDGSRIGPHELYVTTGQRDVRYAIESKLQENAPANAKRQPPAHLRHSN